MHLAVHRTGDAGAVVRAGSPAAAAVAATLAELPPIHHAAARLGGAIPVTPYATYGTGELADQVCKALAGRNAALLANHGGIALGADLGQAIERFGLLEWLCDVYIRARTLGAPRVLTEDELAEVRHRDTYGWGGPDIV
ncbi:hypothetical protein GCM10027294_09520 [Marinactinospora endophytica]